MAAYKKVISTLHRATAAHPGTIHGTHTSSVKSGISIKSPNKGISRSKESFMGTGARGKVSIKGGLNG